MRSRAGCFPMAPKMDPNHVCELVGGCCSMCVLTRRSHTFIPLLWTMSKKSGKLANSVVVGCGNCSPSAGPRLQSGGTKVPVEVGSAVRNSNAIVFTPMVFILSSWSETSCETVLPTTESNCVQFCMTWPDQYSEG